MNEMLALPPRLVMRDLLLTVFAQKFRLCLIFFCVVGLSIGIAARIQPSYKARSSLLVLMGPEHGFRPLAGEPMTNGGGVDAEQVLRTEASILSSDDLHQTVIRDIGIKRMDPWLLQAPGWGLGPVAQWIGKARRVVSEGLGFDAPSDSATPIDPMARAIESFARNLTITVDNRSSVIGLAFTNPDKTVAADALRILETQYLALRAKLFGDVQAPIIEVQRDAIGKQLAAADAALQSFKQQHEIGNFTERRAILLKQQGDQEAAMTKADAVIAELNARLTQLNQQISALPGGKKGNPNAVAALQAMVKAYKRREAEAQTRYLGSPAVVDAGRQALERESDIARLEANQAYALQSDRNKADADLRSSVAGRASIAAQLGDINKQVAALDAEESQVHQLERDRAILEDNYKTVTKILGERQTVEAVEAHRQSSVRVIQPPRVPTAPQPTQRLIMLAGLVISVLLSLGSILMSYFFRAIYLRPEALEMDTGLTVLASVPETREIGGPRSSVLVVPG